MTFIETLMRKVTKVHKFKPGDLISVIETPGYKYIMSKDICLVLETNEEDFLKFIYGYFLLADGKKVKGVREAVDSNFELVQRNSYDRS